MKKTIFCMIAIAIVGLLITSVSSIPVQQSNEPTNSLSVTLSNKEVQKISVPTSYLTQTPTEVDSLPAFGTQAFAFEGDQTHPAFGRTGSSHMAAYTDEDQANIIWTFSTDDGVSYDPGVYYDNGGDYPSIKHWGGTEFYGTYVTDFMDLNGGATYLFHCLEPSDPEGYEMTYWDWSTYGWSDMIDADIACDNNQETWEWGVSTYVISSTYGDGYIDGPTIVYGDEIEEGNGWISWYYYDGCDHTDVDIDNSLAYSYAVYDWEDTTAGNFKLLVRVNDFAEIMNGFDQIYELDDGSNLICPAIAAGDGNIVILAQTDVNGNQDIICYYGSDVSALSSSFVVDTGDDEMYPDVRHISDQTFICTYVKDGDLYSLTTEDGGATWGDEIQVNDPAESVEVEYKTSDLCEKAIKAMYEIYNGEDIDIYLENVFQNQAPSAPTINGPGGGSPNKQLNYDLTSVDPEGSDVKFFVDWGDGNSEETGFTASGTPLTVGHKYTEKGTYIITVKAQDEFGIDSPESTKNVVIPKNKAVNNVVLRILEKYFNLFSIMEYFLQIMGL